MFMDSGDKRSKEASTAASGAQHPEQEAPEVAVAEMCSPIPSQHSQTCTPTSSCCPPWPPCAHPSLLGLSIRSWSCQCGVTSHAGFPELGRVACPPPNEPHHPLVIISGLPL